MKALVTRPRWLLLHAVVLVVAVGMLKLGSWQWGRATEAGRVQNYAYAAQWVLFAAFTVVAYVKLARDEVRDPAPDEAAAPDLPVRAVPAPQPSAEEDPELAAYNDYLRTLAEKRP